MASKVRDSIRPHPSSVNAFSRGEVRGPRRGRVGTRRGQSRVTRRDVHPLVWEAALRLADGDARRIRVVNSGEVVVT